MSRFVPAERGRLLPIAAAGLIGLVTFAPWGFGFSSSHAAVADHIAFAMAFLPISLLIVALPAAAVATACAGAWLGLSPWALGYGSRGVAAWGIDLLVGLALVGLARLALGTPRTDLNSASAES
jgi:hypothetical protein